MKKYWTDNSHHILELATGLDNYNRWIISLFKEYFRKKIIEIGSGLGGLSGLLPKTNTTLSDSNNYYVNHLKKNFRRQIIKLNIENSSLDGYKNSYDTVFSSNVFEHIENDQKALKNSYKLLRKNGRMLLFVPARPEISGSLDISMGHFRRYTKKELVQKTEKAGFKIIKIKYVNFPGYFTWWFRGKLPIKPDSDNFTARIFDHMIVPFLYLEKYFPVPFGQSLMLIALKP